MARSRLHVGLGAGHPRPGLNPLRRTRPAPGCPVFAGIRRVPGALLRVATNNDVWCDTFSTLFQQFLAVRCAKGVPEGVGAGNSQGTFRLFTHSSWNLEPHSSVALHVTTKGVSVA